MTLSEEDDWKGVFKDVEMAHVNKGKVETYNYYIKEEKINGYDSSIVGDAYNGFIVTNTPSKGELVIKKVDDQGNTITDSPATFTLYQEDEAKYTATTDQGVAKFEGVLPGVYSLMETQAPRGYEPDPTIYTVIADLNEEGEVELRVLDSEENILDNHPLIITNTLMRAELIVEKVDDGGDTITQNPATFVLKQGGDIKDTQQTRADGKAIFTGLLPGTYTLEEVQAPEGYERDATIFTIEVRLDKNGKIVVLAGDTIITADNPLKVTNTILGTLTIKKEIGEGDGQHDPNQTFVFEIKQYEVMENGSKGAFVRTFYETIRVNSGSGSKTIIDLPRGYYEVTEKSDWSWQYEADGPMVKGGALGLQGKSSIETSFTNTPKKVSWLTSIDWVINLFTGGDN